MFKLKQIRPAGSDCTAPYEVILDKEYTVREFINTVLTNEPREWGSIGIIKRGAVFGDPCCEYRCGELLSHLPDDILDRNIDWACAHGGWSLMNYQLRLKEINNEQKEN